jgi:GxxExxY protein
LNLKKSHAKTPRRKELKIPEENPIAAKIVDSAFSVHQKLGPGLLETVYEVVLAHEVAQKGLRVERQKSIPIAYDHIIFDEGFRADLIVEDKVIVEIKSLEAVKPVHKKQLITYLRLTGKRLGLLINFGSALIKDGLFRIANYMPD